MKHARLLAIAASAFAAATASADLFQFTASPSGDQEVPPSGSPATGTMTGVYDDVANTFSFEWSVMDLLGTPASPGSHIHNAPAGSNGPIVFGFNNPDGSWPLMGSATWSGLSPDEVQALFDGNLYINFHTDQFAPGELRGQITLVPAPGALALVGVGGLAALRRRR